MTNILSNYIPLIVGSIYIVGGLIGLVVTIIKRDIKIVKKEE